ncbi:TPA: hypothetical protein ACXJLS_000377 [Stenotrophomonas maltophilia]
MNLEQIDTSTTAGKAEVMRLAAEGRRVMTRRGAPACWEDCNYPVWDWSAGEYAIIAEPVGPEEIFVVMRHDQSAAAVCDTMERARSWNDLPIVRYIREDLVGGEG